MMTSTVSSSIRTAFFLTDRHRLAGLNSGECSVVEALRQHGNGDLNGVTAIVLETNGELSVVTGAGCRSGLWLDRTKWSVASPGCWR